MNTRYTRSSYLLPSVFMVLLILAVIGVVLLQPATPQEQADMPEGFSVNPKALTCVTHQNTGYHIHPVLSITLLGDTISIPQDIGITPLCMGALHTHDTTGKLHIEYPTAINLTLGDFFGIWEQPFSKNQIMNHVVAPDEKMVLTVNGKQVESYENTPLYDGDLIHIEVSKKE